MHRLACTLLVLFGASSGAIAQVYVADPLDNPNSSTGNVIPFGHSGTTFDEARSHFYFPAAYLPGTGGYITAIELSASTTVTTTYELFELSIDHTASSSLSTVFASNLTAPQVVYSLVNQPIAWTTGWVTIPLQTPFLYDGTSNLVIECRKIVDRPLNPPTVSTLSHRVLVWPRRADTVPPVWTYTAYGAGGASAPVATLTYNTEVIFRLHFRGGPTLTVDSTRDTTGNASRSYFHIGATITLTNQGTPSAPYATFFEATIFPAGISIPGFGGELWLTSFTYLIDSGALNASGVSTFSAVIPRDPTLVGLQAHFQSLVVGGTLDFTNIVKAPVAAY